jgi:hypothetical protein
MRSQPIFEPQRSSSALADHPHRMTLVHGGAGLAYPALCPNCGETASKRIDVQKVFERYSDGYEYVTATIGVPYCDRCIAEHRRELRTLGWPQRLVVSLVTQSTIGALCFGVAALAFLPAALRDLTRPSFPILVLVVSCCALIAYWFLAQSWSSTAHRRVPPQTSITRTFDFSDSHAEAFDAPRATYSIRNAAFAEAFMALNRDRVWNPEAPTAQRAARSRKLIYGLALAGLAARLLWDLVSALFR